MRESAYLRQAGVDANEVRHRRAENEDEEELGGVNEGCVNIIS